MLKFINKSIQHQFIFFNRSVEKAENLVSQLQLNAKIFPLSELGNQKLDYDYIISCTGSKDIILNEDKFRKINPENKKNELMLNTFVDEF